MGLSMEDSVKKFDKTLSKPVKTSSYEISRENLVREFIFGVITLQEKNGEIMMDLPHKGAAFINWYQVAEELGDIRIRK